MPALDQFLNIAAYHFTSLSDLDGHRQRLRSAGKRLGVKGTILLTPEGINLFLSGRPETLDQFMQQVRSIDGLSELEEKRSWSDEIAFHRFLVKIKSEIIAFGIDGIAPAQYTSPRVSAQQLRQWLDEGRPVHLLDTRNDYEVQIGTFAGAHAIGVDHFRDFPTAIKQLPESWKEEPVVTFCTGGIRCEKAAPLMERLGFRQVYQLDGGILKYFEEVGGAHWNGDCFVFDQRVSLRPDLSPGSHVVCFACQAVLTVDDIQSPLYVPPKSCPHCYQTSQQRMEQTLRERKSAWDALTDPPPGSLPYIQRRPLRVAQKHAGMTALDFVASLNTPLSREQWTVEIANGFVVRDEQALSAEDRVQPGEAIAHLAPIQCEPVMSRDIQFLYEDDDWIVINKPAPLAVHASGRYCRHSLVWLLARIYAPEKPRPAHRLDVATTGVMVFTRNRLAAARTQRQFELGTVEKVYRARVAGHPRFDDLVHEAAIARTSEEGMRALDPAGREATTRIRVLSREADGTSLVEAIPITGRTNQIRLHLADLGHPIIDDPWYGPTPQERSSEVDRAISLHAHRLRLIHPTLGEPMEWVAEREL